MSLFHTSTMRTPRVAALALILAAALGSAAAGAQPMPPPGPPPGGPPLPSAEELATLPGVTAAQQAELRKILLERRDALDAMHEKSRAAMDAQRTRDRDEHERIEQQSSERMRKLLGDDGYRQYAEWQLAHRGPPRGPDAVRPDALRGPGPGQGPGPGGRERGAPPPPATPDAPRVE